MYEKILLPYDGSDGAGEVLHHAAEIANWNDAVLDVLYVADTTRDSVTVVDGQVVDTLVQQGEDIVAEAAKTLDTLGVDYETDVVQGNPAPTITDYADRYGHDLILMSTRGRDGISRYLLGSVSEKVVRLSSVPVLTARMQPDEQLSFPYENILIPTDGSTAASHAATHGLALAETLEATVHVLSVVDDGFLNLDIRGSETEHDSEQAATNAIESVTSAAAEYDLPALVEEVEHATPADGIREYIDAHDIDAVVMGTTGHRKTERILLGSVAEATVRTAPVPVLTVEEPTGEQ
jgi:nucleotide-binding universal stress UspA family protein